MINKKFNNKGSAFTIVIIAMALSLMIMFIVSFQINYQINTNSKHYMDMQQKYLAESGIDKVIADISSTIESEIKNTKTSYSYNSISTYSEDKYSHKGHEPIDFTKDMESIYRAIINMPNHIVSDYIYNGENGLDKIKNILLQLNQPNTNLTLSNNLNNDVEKLRTDTWNKLGSDGNSYICQLGEYVKANNIHDINDSEYQKRVSKIGIYIDDKIKEVLTIQQKLNELYIKSNNKNESLEKKVNELQNKFESVKYYLEEIKCKLGIKITGSAEDGDNNSSPSSQTITINIPNYKFPNESTYKSDGYETQELNIPVTINYTNGSISSVEPITVDNIISIGYKDNKEYKMSANITFNIGKENNTYRVISYKVNKWKKI